MSGGGPRLERRQFASDNYAGICPEAWAAMASANTGHARAYGEDEWTLAACNLIREVFECDCEIYFVFNGTAANSLALASLCHSYHSIVCHETAHVETDECGAPEFFSNGTKLLLAPGENGKIDPEEVIRIATRRTDIHYPKPRVLSVTQPTELGTGYSIEELRRLGELARRFDLRFHMDGARLANALATLAASPRQLTWEVGVDVLCLGGVKNGLGVGEAVVFFKRELAQEFDLRCKQAGQLASKTRFLTAPWVGLLENGVWLKYATHANQCARLLEAGLRAIPGVRIMFPVQANSVFVELPAPVAERLRQQGWHFYSFIGVGGVRLMCSWDTTAEDIHDLLGDLRQCCQNS